MSTLSVCIATHERAHLLRRALDGLLGQERPPDEVVISDSSTSASCEAVVRSYVARGMLGAVIYRRTPRRALQWQRWFAFEHSCGQIVLFLDDDVWLAPTALLVLERAYDNLRKMEHRPVVGVGFLQSWEDGSQPTRYATALRERWLGTSRRPAGTVTRGGLSVSMGGLTAHAPIRVDYLWGGAMSYRREVLLEVGFLDRLAALYDAGIGRGEDAVLSAHGGKHGSLYIITQALARHPSVGEAASTPYATSGWRLGLTGTWGKAHTLRWIATDTAAYRRALSRVITLELARSARALLTRPWGWVEWQRMAGACYGMLQVVGCWRRIPISARSVEKGQRVSDRANVMPVAADVPKASGEPLRLESDSDGVRTDLPLAIGVSRMETVVGTRACLPRDQKPKE